MSTIIAENDQYEVSIGHESSFTRLTKKAVPGMTAQHLWITPRLMNMRQDLMEQVNLWLKQFHTSDALVQHTGWAVYALTRPGVAPEMPK